MALTDQKMPLRQMFSPRDVTPERVREILALDELKAKTAMAKLNIDLSEAKRAGQDVGSLLSLVEIFYTPAMVALGNRLSSAGYTQAEISAALMVADGSLTLD